MDIFEKKFMNKPKILMKWIIFFVMAISSSVASAKYDWAVRGHDEVWRQECSACHMAYLPKWLSADNWRKIMQGLDRHFGSNASLGTREREEITSYLVSHAALDSDGNYSSETLRITDTPWWSRHGPNAARFWVKGLVGNAANCTACHKGADFR